LLAHLSPSYPRSHVILANLRKPGEKGYKIPQGGAFNYVTCANYMFEVKAGAARMQKWMGSNITA
jgi:very-long-chain enoyl-CoA reductase